MKTYSFTLELTDFGDLDQEVEDALYEAGCDDASLGISNGTPQLAFDRAARSFLQAVKSAIDAVQRAADETGRPLAVVRVRLNDVVTMAEIARRTVRSREGVRKLVLGERGPGRFPQPVREGPRSMAWQWDEVVLWLEGHKLLDPKALTPEVREAFEVHALNAALTLRRMETRARRPLLEIAGA